MDSLRGTREAGKDSLDSLRGTREAGKDQLDSLRGTREAPGRQERAIWTACEAPDSLGGTREAGKDQLDSLGGTREAGKDQLDSLRGNPGFGRALDVVSLLIQFQWRTARFAANSGGGLDGRLPSTDWPLKCRSEHLTGGHQGGRKGLFGRAVMV